MANFRNVSHVYFDELNYLFISVMVSKELINKNFIIKVNGVNFIGDPINKRVRFNGLVEILGDEQLAKSICQKAWECKDVKYTKRLRRGLIIKFYQEDVE